MSKLFLIVGEMTLLDDIYLFGKENTPAPSYTTKGTATPHQGFCRHYLQKCFLKSNLKSGQFSNWTITNNLSLELML